MVEEKPAVSGAKSAPGGVAERGPEHGGLKDGVFDGTVRYDGTVLVERVVDGETVTVMTDKPRVGDKIQAHALNVETGKLEQSKHNSAESGVVPPRR